MASKGVQDIRALFPVTKGYAYLNSAAVGPLSAPARNAMRRLIRDQCDRGGARLEQWGETIEACRTAAARLIGAQPDEVALVPNTSAGLATVAAGLHATPGENIVIPEREFPSNVYPWMALPGVEVRQVPKRDGRLLAEEVARCVDSRTRAVSVSFVDWLTGHRPDLKAIGKVARHYGALFVVDAIQGAGALPLDVEADAIDALAFGAHKWVCGPEGVAVLYVSRLARERIAPTRPSWMSVRRAGHFLDYDLAPASGARRYEDGTPNTCGIYGLLAALDLIAEITVPVIAERVLALARLVREGARARGLRLACEAEGDEASGIVSFLLEDAPVYVTALAQRKILVAARHGHLRVATHHFNNEEDVARLLEAFQ